MTKYSFGDIVFIEFYQFASGDKKKRPAMVILDIGDNDVVVCPVTTRKWSGAGDYFLEDWKKSGLKKESWARLAKVSCLEKSDIVRVFGKVTNDDREQLLVVLRRLLEL